MANQNVNINRHTVTSICEVWYVSSHGFVRIMVCGTLLKK